MTPTYRILFVCMGNICRSPAAEGVMTTLLQSGSLPAKIVVDSAGTGGWHAGNRADPRMRSAASLRGHHLTSLARQVCPSDFDSFDLILAMDKDNLSDLRQLQRQNPGKADLRLFCDFCSDHEEVEVPDPYYGGEAGFEKVLDLLEDGCAGILADLKQRFPSP